jgi:hypothetical protein
MAFGCGRLQGCRPARTRTLARHGEARMVLPRDVTKRTSLFPRSQGRDRSKMAVLRPIVLACLWRSNVAFLLAPPARLALGRLGRSTTSSSPRVGRSLPPPCLAAAVPLRDNFAPDVAVIAGAQAQNLAAHGAAIVFVPQARANLTVARDARSNPEPEP